MTPLEIEILLHYKTHIGDYRSGDFWEPKVCKFIHACRTELGLLRKSTPDDHKRDCANRTSVYVLTDRGKMYIDAVCAVPLPIQKWIMPEAAKQEQG